MAGLIDIKVRKVAKGTAPGSRGHGGAGGTTIIQGSAEHAKTAGEADFAKRSAEARHAAAADKAGYADKAGHASTADRFSDSAIDDLNGKYIRKDQADRTPYALDTGGLHTAEQGVQFGKAYNPDMFSGYGGLIDGAGNGVLESLTLRRSLRVPEIIFNRTKVELGNSWRAPGGGKIREVHRYEEDSEGAHIPYALNQGRIVLDLEEGEPGAVAEGDLCMGIFHFESGNDTENFDGHNGDFRFAGFTTVYFKVTKVLKTDGSEFLYELRPGWDTHPKEEMNFVGYANPRDNERQSFWYATRTYEAYISGATDWNFRDENIMMLSGDLTGWVYNGKNFAPGYSMFVRNLYMSGTIEHVEEAARMELTCPGVFLADTGGLELTVRITRQYRTIDLKDCTLSVVRESGNAASDKEWNAKPHAFSEDGRLMVTKSDMGGAAQAMFIVTAVVPAPHLGESETEEVTAAIELYTKDGLGVAVVAKSEVTYAVGSDGQTPPTEGWTETIPAVPEGKWLWTRTVVTYSDNSKVESYSVGRNGVDGKSPLTIDLDNEIVAIPVDYEGKLEKDITLSTGVDIYGTDEDTEWEVSAYAGTAITDFETKDTDIFGKGGDVTITLKKGNTIPGETFDVLIEAWGKRHSTATISKLWKWYTVRAARPGESATIYDLDVTPGNVTRHADGSLSASSVTVKVKESKGDAMSLLLPSALNGKGVLTYIYEGVTSSSTPVPADGVIAVPANATAINIYLHSVDGVLLDSERVPVVRDGADGEEGRKTVMRKYGDFPTGITEAQLKEWGAAGYNDNWGCENFADMRVGDYLIVPFVIKPDGMNDIDIVRQLYNGEELEQGYIMTEITAIGTEDCHYWGALVYSEKYGDIIETQPLSRNISTKTIYYERGRKGADGNGIDKVAVRYYVKTPAEGDGQPMDNEFNDFGGSTINEAKAVRNIQSLSGCYIWCRITTTYTKVSTTTVEYSVSRVGADGGTGKGVHIAYATDVTLGADGKPTACTGFSVTPFSGYVWMGLYTDSKGETADSTDFHDYTWVRVKGEDGSSYTENLLRNSKGEFVTETTGDGDHYKIFRDTSAYLEQGKEYTISARTNAAQFGGNHGAFFDHCCLLLCSLATSPQGTVNNLIGHTNMATDGSKGYTFTWNHPTGEYFLRTNFYTAGSWWVSHVKIELGHNEHPVWTPHPDDLEGPPGADAVTYRLVPSITEVHYNPNTKTYSDRNLLVKVMRQAGDNTPEDIAPDLLDGDYNYGNPYGITVDCSESNDPDQYLNGYGSTGLTLYDFPVTLTLKRGGKTIETVTIPLVSDGKDGEPGQSVTGPAGAIMRTTEWQQGNKYYAGKTEVNGFRYLDIVCYGTGQNKGYYLCIADVSGNTPPDQDANHWRKFSGDFPVYAPTLFAENARIEFMNGQEIIVSDQNGNVCGRIGMSRNGKVMWMGGSDTGNATYILEEDGHAYHGGMTGQRIEIDPTDKSIKVYDQDGKKTSEIDGNQVNPDEAFPASAGEAQRTFSSQTITDSYSTVATRTLGTVTGAAKSAPGFIRINTGSFTVSLKTSRYSTSSGSMQEQRIICFTQVLLTAILTVGGTIKKQLLGMMEVSQRDPTVSATGSFTAPSSMMTAFVPAGVSYSFRIEAEPRFGGESSRSPEGSIDISGISVQPYHCLDNFQSGLHRNGLFVSRNSENYFGALFNDDSMLDFRAVAGGCPVFKRLVFHGTLVTQGGKAEGIYFYGAKSAYGGVPVQSAAPSFTGSHVILTFKIPDSWKPLGLHSLADEFVITPAYNDVGVQCRVDTAGVDTDGTFKVIIPWYDTWCGPCYLDIYKF